MKLYDGKTMVDIAAWDYERDGTEEEQTKDFFNADELFFDDDCGQFADDSDGAYYVEDVDEAIDRAQKWQSEDRENREVAFDFLRREPVYIVNDYAEFIDASDCAAFVTEDLDDEYFTDSDWLDSDEAYFDIRFTLSISDPGDEYNFCDYEVKVSSFWK